MEGVDSTSRPARQLVIGAVGLYRRYPLLFLTLAAGVIAPYQLIVLVTTGAGPFTRSSLGLSEELLLTLVELVLITPLVSALHVHAVLEVRGGRDPRLVPVARQGVLVLPVVAAASIVSGLGIAVGLAAFVVPGVFLMLRWFVVAQSAAIEQEGWLPALRRSHQLTKGNYGHIAIFAIYIGLITSGPALLIGLALGQGSTTAASFLVGLVVQVLAWSFGALATALLYFDLRLRRETSLERQSIADVGPAGQEQAQIGDPLDPYMYSDQSRPKGWYIDPDSPRRMRYWGVNDSPGWGATTRTPRRIRHAWKERN